MLDDPFENSPDVDPSKLARRPLKYAAFAKASSDFLGQVYAMAGTGDPEAKGIKARARPVDHNPRTRKLYESLGYLVEKSETIKSFPGGHVTCDLWGIADYIALKESEPVMVVQACAKGQLGAHLRKFASLPAAWLMAKNPCLTLEICLWHQCEGSRRWSSHRMPIEIEDLQRVLDRRR